MHITDGVLSPVLMMTTNLAGVGLTLYSLRQVSEDEIPKVALMSAAFCVASTIHFKVGPTSVHLMFNGLIGIMLGKKAPVALMVALIFQLFILQFGGMTTLGANVITTAVPAIILGLIARRALNTGWSAKLIGGITGALSVCFTLILLILILIESNFRFGIGPISVAKTLVIAYIPVMIIEAIVTAFTLQYIIKSRPELVIDTENK